MAEDFRASSAPPFIGTPGGYSGSLAEAVEAFSAPLFPAAEGLRTGQWPRKAAGESEPISEATKAATGPGSRERAPTRERMLRLAQQVSASGGAPVDPGLPALEGRESLLARAAACRSGFRGPPAGSSERERQARRRTGSARTLLTARPRRRRIENRHEVVLFAGSEADTSAWAFRARPAPGGGGTPGLRGSPRLRSRGPAYAIQTREGNLFGDSILARPDGSHRRVRCRLRRNRRAAAGRVPGGHPRVGRGSVLDAAGKAAAPGARVAAPRDGDGGSRGSRRRPFRGSRSSS